MKASATPAHVEPAMKVHTTTPSARLLTLGRQLRRYQRSGMMTTNRCYAQKAIILVELEPAAVAPLLDASSRGLKDWGEGEPRHDARAPLRLVVQSGPDTADFGLR